MTVRNRLIHASLACALSATAFAQQSPSPRAIPSAPAPAPAPSANIDLRMIRMKISAGDLPSAESILEYHRTQTGEDGDYILGIAWVARGAALVRDWKAATVWARLARQIAEAKLKTPADYQIQEEAVYALGTAIEVEAQTLEAAGRKAEAIRLLDDNEKAQEKAQAPYNLRARIWKRRNQIELVGQKAPEIRAEDHVAGEFRSLESLRGKPVVLFFWWESCGDCKMQAATFRRVVERYSRKDVAFVAPTRFYGKAEERTEEKGKVEKSWSELYKLTRVVPVPISDEAMLRYGVSATPTFVFVDRRGVVTRYSPTRLTEARLSAAIDELLE